MIALFSAISLRHFLQQKLRTSLTLFGVGLGVGMIVAIAIVNQSTLQSFQKSVNQISGRASLQVTAGQTGFPEEIVERVQSIAGVEYAVPVIEAGGLIKGAKEPSLQILAVDVLQDYHLREYDLSGEHADIPDPLLFLARPDSILVSRQVTEREGIALDSEMTLQTIWGEKTFKVRGILEPTGPAKAFGGNLAVMDLFSAQRAFGKEGRVDRIDISLLPEANREEVKRAIAAVLPKGYRIDPPASRTRQVEVLLQAFQTMLGFVSGTALLVGMYLIYNAVSIAVVQRRYEIGLLRALGARRRQIRRLLFTEVGGLALLGSLGGMAVGILFGKGVLGIVGKTVSEIYVNVVVDTLILPWRQMALAAVAGVGASVAAAVLPVREALRIPPQSAIRSLPIREDRFSSSHRALLLSLALMSASGFLYFLFRHSGLSRLSHEGGYLAAFLFVVGVSFSTPFFLQLLLGGVRSLGERQAGALIRLVGLSLQKHLGRNAMAAGAILFSVAIFIATAGFIGSMKRSILDDFVHSVRADIYVTAGHPFASRGGQNIPMQEAFGEEIRTIRGVRSVDPFRMISIEYNGIQHLLMSVDVALWESHSHLKMADGPADSRVPGQESCLVSEGFATLHHVRRGDVIHLPTPGGVVPFRVNGISVNYTSDTGSVQIDRSLYKKYWGDTLVDTFSVQVEPGTDPGIVRAAILDRYGKERRLFVLLNKEYVSAVTEVLDQPLAAMSALEAVALIIGAGGIIVALLASVAERTREIGMLRGLGMTRREVARIIVFEAAFLGLVGGILGNLAGFATSWILLNGVVRVLFGASVLFAPPWGVMLMTLIGSVFLAALAGLYPAMRVARMNIVGALAYE